MATRSLPSDPQLLLRLIDEIDSDDSDDGWDGYVEEDDEELLTGWDKRHEDYEEFEVIGQERMSIDSDGVEDDEVNVTEERATGTMDTTMGSNGATDNEESYERQSSEENESSTNESSQRNSSIPPYSKQPHVVPDMIGKEPIDFFKLFFTDATFDEILVETNRYGDQYVDSHQEHLAAHKQARAHNFIQKCFSIGELYKFIALILTMGIVSLPKIPHYWSTKWPFFSTNFSPVMKRDRFQLLLKMLHLANNSSMIPHGQPGHDKLFKLRPLLDSLVERFKLMYQPNRELAVDESMIGFKGRLSFLQYIPNKPHKWGLKAWVLADSRTGYVCNWKLYTGKEAGGRSQYGLAEKVVLDLTSHLSNSGHHIYTDNFYTSPILCKRLLEIGFGSCGTARSNRRGIPHDFGHKTGEVITFRDGELTGIRWMDKRAVTVLSTVHDDEMVDVRRRTRQAPLLLCHSTPSTNASSGIPPLLPVVSLHAVNFLQIQFLFLHLLHQFVNQHDRIQLA